MKNETVAKTNLFGFWEFLTKILRQKVFLSKMFRKETQDNT